MKKPKEKKVPRRGQGVAVLEEIIKEQDSCPRLFSTTNPLQPPGIVADRCSFRPAVHLPPPPPPYRLCNLQQKQPPPPPVSAFYSSSNSNDSSNHNLRIYARPTNEIEASRNFSCVPILQNGWIHNELNQSTLPMFQRKQQMVNLRPQIITQPFPSSQSSGLYEFIEPPSNQRCCHDYTSKFPEEEMTPRRKRLRRFLTETPPLNATSSIETPNKIPSNLLDLRLRSSTSDYGASGGVKFYTADSSSSPAVHPPAAQNCPRDFLGSTVGTRFFQDYSNSRHSVQNEPEENVEEYVHERSHPTQSVYLKPFYGFFPTEKQNPEETFFGFKNQSEASKDCDLDLTLKL